MPAKFSATIGLVTAAAGLMNHRIEAGIADFPLVVDGWGSSANGKSAPLVSANDDIVAISAGHEHSVALTASGSVFCWGWNVFGQTTVPSIGEVISIDAGCEHTVACLATGSVVCWGRNFEGQCNVPATLDDAIVVGGGDVFSCALRSGGSVVCWGTNSDGQCVPPSTLRNAVGLSAGGAHCVALRASGDVACWGWNAEGQSSPPSNLTGVVQVSGGGSHTAVVKGDGTVVCWGANQHGQCVVPAQLGTVVQVDAGGAHTVALKADGSVVAWGRNTNAQCVAPKGTSGVEAVSAGRDYTLAILPAAARNLTTAAVFARLDSCLEAASSGDTLLTSPLGVDGETLDYRGKALWIRCVDDAVRSPDSVAIFADGGRLTVDGSVMFDGTTTIPLDSNATIEASGGIDFGGLTRLLPGSAVLASAADASTTIGGTLDILRATLVCNEDLSVSAGGSLRTVEGIVEAPAIDITGDAIFLRSALLGATTVRQSGQLSGSGELLGELMNQGDVIASDDVTVFGDLVNAPGAKLIAQAGVIYVTGDLSNSGSIYGEVIDAPSFQGGSNSADGDGVRVMGSLIVGQTGSLVFPENIWRISLCGDLTLACASSEVRLDEATVAADGCEGTMQTFEATSADLGCVAAAFSGEETTVSLIGELDVASGATVTLVDNFNNAPGKAAEVVYARGLTVKPGATLVTNGIKVVTRNALIQGTVDDMSNICVVPDAPNPDINGDGHVNAIDLSFILAYFGSSTPIADLDDDGIVGGADLSIVLSGWTS